MSNAKHFRKPYLPPQVKRRHAVIRYMFFNPADVEYFKPVEVYTKMGLQGILMFRPLLLHLQCICRRNHGAGWHARPHEGNI
jgi:hypothetical protein